MTWFKAGLLVVLAYAAIQISPLVPKASRFLDDVHEFRNQLAGFKDTADRGVKALESIKIKFWEHEKTGTIEVQE